MSLFHLGCGCACERAAGLFYGHGSARLNLLVYSWAGQKGQGVCQKY